MISEWEKGREERRKKGEREREREGRGERKGGGGETSMSDNH